MGVTLTKARTELLRHVVPEGATALEADLGRASVATGVLGAGRFAAGEGRGAAGAGV